MKNKINQITFIPNWNGHLYLAEETDNSVTEIFEKYNQDKKLLTIEKNNIEETTKIIKEELKDKNNGFFCVTGDHSNTYELFKDFVEKQPSKEKQENVKLVIFDAHPDVEISTDMVSHEDYLRNLIENKYVKPENIYIFGLRTMSRVEFEYLNNSGANYYTIFDCLKNPKEIKKVLEDLQGDIYLSFDIDCLDPDFAPATHYKEWCGFNMEEVTSLLEIIAPKSSYGDICEYYKNEDEEDVTLNNVLKLIDIINK